MESLIVNSDKIKNYMTVMYAVKFMKENEFHEYFFQTFAVNYFRSTPQPEHYNNIIEYCMNINIDNFPNLLMTQFLYRTDDEHIVNFCKLILREDI